MSEVLNMSIEYLSKSKNIWHFFTSVKVEVLAQKVTQVKVKSSSAFLVLSKYKVKVLMSAHVHKYFNG